MKKVRLSIYRILVCVFIAVTMAGCSAGNVASPQVTALVQRGDLEVKVNADGSIETPSSLNLYFDTTMFSLPYSSRIRKIYVEKGETVKAGALLAKLDDTAQKMAVEAAQYALELALNNVVQTVCCGVPRSPGFYCDAVAFKRFEFAQSEVNKAQVYLLDGKYEQSSEQITLARLDLEAAREYYSDPDYLKYRADSGSLNDVNQSPVSNTYIDNAIARLTSEIDKLSLLQQQLKEGKYGDARDTVQYIIMEMGDSYSVIKGLNHLPWGMETPDTCTTYTVIYEVMSSLDKLEALSQQKEIDSVKYAETLSMARHELELTGKIIQENISTFRSGLNMKALRDYNINIQTAIINLERTKQALLRTELIAPFDGRVEDINLRSGDLITQRYASNSAPIDSYVIRLADTSYIRMVGTVDEIGALKVKAGQKARVYVDAAPGRTFDGTVKFISNYGPLQSGGIQYYGTIQPTVATYKVEIEIDKQQATGLYGGLTASAEILTDTRSSVLMVPNGAISGQPGEYTARVMTAEKGSVIEQRSVKIGVQTRSQTEILSGLKEGEKVIVDKPASPARPLSLPK